MCTLGSQNLSVQNGIWGPNYTPYSLQALRFIILKSLNYDSIKMIFKLNENISRFHFQVLHFPNLKHEVKIFSFLT